MKKIGKVMDELHLEESNDPEEKTSRFINKYGLDVSKEEYDAIHEKMKMITHQTNGSVKTTLLQKNARCPECAGTLKKHEYHNEMVYMCINCKTMYKPIDIGMNDNELICEVVKCVRSDLY